MRDAVRKIAMNQQYQIGDYRQTYRTFSLPRPERYNWTYEVFDKWAADPGKRAMLWVSGDGEARDVTYREFAVRSKQVANALSGIGARPGDRVMDHAPAPRRVVGKSCSDASGDALSRCPARP